MLPSAKCASPVSLRAAALRARSQYQADSQLNALAIPAGDVRQDFTVSGYVFFPKGNYSDIVMLVTNGETGNTEIIKQPWR